MCAKQGKDMQGKNVYRVSFSIHGTNCFIVATLNSDKSILPSREFRQVPSRARQNDKKFGTKLFWTALNGADGKQLSDPAIVLLRFRELEHRGWTLVPEYLTAFCEKHNLPLTQIAQPQPEVVQPEVVQPEAAQQSEVKPETDNQGE